MIGPAVGQWRISLDAQRAQLLGTVAALDAGMFHACVRVYSEARPDQLGGGIEHMAEITLAKPCGTVTAEGVLVLQALEPEGVLVLTSGIPRWAELVAGDGTVLLDGGVTDLANDGCFRVGGAATPAGDNSPQFYAGMLLQLSATALT